MSRRRVSVSPRLEVASPQGVAAFARAWAIPVVVGVATVLAVLLGETAYQRFTREDGICEWLQVLFFSLALVEAVRARTGFARSGERANAGLYLVAIVGLFVLVGEEISWGQRIFGWSTPETFGANRQGETTIHNLGSAHDLVGWVLLGIGLWGALPWVVEALPLSARARRLLVPFIPSKAQAPCFLPMAPWRLYRNLFPLPERHGYAIMQLNEPLELVMAIGFWLFFRERAREARATSPRETRERPAVRPLTPSSRRAGT